MPDKRHWLQALRKANGLTLEALSRAADVSLKTVTRWEAGVAEPRFCHRLALARLLGVEVLHHFAEDSLAAFEAENGKAS